MGWSETLILACYAVQFYIRITFITYRHNAVELRHLRYFIAVAEAEGFARAADRLHVTQPALSRQVRELEEELQVKLLHRSKRGVTVTAAGRAFLDDAHRLLLDLERANLRARGIQSGKLGTLTIGLTDPFSWHRAVTESIRTFRRANPDVALSVIVMNSRDQLVALREGRLSGGFLLSRPADERNFEAIKVLADRIMVAVSKTSRFARQRPNCLADFAGETFFWFPRGVNPVYYDDIIRACRRGKLEANIFEGGLNDTANLSLVAAGLGCTFVPSEARRRKPQNVVLLPVEDLNVELTMEFVWRAENCSPALGNFIKVLEANT